MALLTAYRRGARWAWRITWRMIAVFGLTILYAPHAGRHYLVVAVLMAGAQFMTRRAFPLVR